jgi:hypothetical protein
MPSVSRKKISTTTNQISFYGGEAEGGRDRHLVSTMKSQEKNL